MSKTRIIVLICLGLVILGFVATLSIDTESWWGNIIYGNPFIPALLFFAFFAAFAGILKILVDLLLPNRLSKEESKGWGRTRAKGKMIYVLSALLLTGIPIVLGLAIQFADSDGSSYVLRNFVVLVLVLIGGIAAIANALWDYQESIYLKAKERGEVASEGNGNARET